MPQGTLEERVTRLEEIVDQFLHSKSGFPEPGRHDWRKTFGMFAGDPVMKEIIDAGRRIREQEREQAQS